MTFDGLSLAKLPNMDLFPRGITQYVHGKSRLSSAHQRAIDPEFARLNAIRDVLRNGIGFIDRLGAQELVLYRAVLNKYQNAQNTMSSEMQRIAKLRLVQDSIPGIKLSELVPIPSVDLPTSIAGSTPNAESLTSAEAHKIASMCRNNKDKALHIPKLVASALSLGIGQLVFQYQAKQTQAASTSMDFQGKGWATHNTKRRHVSWNVTIAYQVNGANHPLFDIPFSFTPNGEVYSCRSDNQEGIQHQNQALVRRDQSISLEKYLSNNWGAPLKINAVYNLETLKQALAEPIVNVCMIEPLPSNTVVAARIHAFNQALMRMFVADPTLLDASIRRQDLLRQCLLMYTGLLGYPGHDALTRLPKAQELDQALQAYVAAPINERQAFAGRRIDSLISTAFQSAQDATEISNFTQRELPIKHSLEGLLHSLDLLQVSTSIEVEPEPAVEVVGLNQHDDGMRMGKSIGMSIIIRALHDSGRREAAAALSARYPELIEFQVEPGMSWAVQRGILQALSLKLMETVPTLLPNHIDDYMWLSMTFSGSIQEAITNQTRGTALLNHFGNTERQSTSLSSVAGPSGFFGRSPQVTTVATQQPAQSPAAV